MSNQEFDFLLRHILLDSIKAYTDQCEYVSFLPSVHYRRQVKSMLSNPLNWVRKRMYPLWKRTLRAVAMIVITISIAVGCLIAISPTVRAVVGQWVKEICDKYISYRYIGEDEFYDVQDYEIKKLPNGYIEEKRNSFPRMGDVEYKNQDGKYILLHYVYMESGSISSYVTNSEIEPVNVIVNGTEGTYWASSVVNGFNTLMWMDSKSNLQFTIDAQLPYIDILHMAESVSLCIYTK